MIKKLEEDSVFEAIKLMDIATRQNFTHNLVIKRNEAKWIKFLIGVVQEQAMDNPNFLAIGEYQDNELRGFILANAFINHYNDEPVIDIKDCIVDFEKSTPYTVIRLYNSVMDHMRKNGFKRWRADSIRNQEDTLKYAKLLQHKYNADLFYAAHGNIGE